MRVSDLFPRIAAARPFFSNPGAPMTLETFRARFPQFRSASDELVQSKLDEATRRVAPETFGAVTDDAIGYLAAHLLAIAPMGTSQRLEDDKTETVYWKEYRALQKATAVRWIVT